MDSSQQRREIIVSYNFPGVLLMPVVLLLFPMFLVIVPLLAYGSYRVFLTESLWANIWLYTSPILAPLMVLLGVGLAVSLIRQGGAAIVRLGPYLYFTGPIILRLAVSDIDDVKPLEGARYPEILISLKNGKTHRVGLTNMELGPESVSAAILAQTI